MMKVIRTVLLALLASLVLGLVIGTLIRIRLERPVVYFVGQIESITAKPSAAAARAPGNVGYFHPTILDPRHHEEQVG